MLSLESDEMMTWHQRFIAIMLKEVRSPSREHLSSDSVHIAGGGCSPGNDSLTYMFQMLIVS